VLDATNTEGFCIGCHMSPTNGPTRSCARSRQ
jgi:nitrate/TMAO reductase-like tetraheme cytochrome c subunit